MNKTKKGFLIAGSIISILTAVFMLFMSLGLSLVNIMIDEEFIIDDYRNDPYYKLVENLDGSYIVYDDLGNVEMTSDDIDIVVSISKFIINAMSFGIATLSIATLIFAIRILVKVSKSKSCKGSIITLLVLSLYYCNILSVAFMIVALCLKDNKQEINDTPTTSENTTVA